jgi:hypothetical protein
MFHANNVSVLLWETLLPLLPYIYRNWPIPDNGCSDQSADQIRTPPSACRTGLRQTERQSQTSAQMPMFFVASKHRRD